MQGIKRALGLKMMSEIIQGKLKVKPIFTVVRQNNTRKAINKIYFYFGLTRNDNSQKLKSNFYTHGYTIKFLIAKLLHTEDAYYLYR